MTINTKTDSAILIRDTLFEIAKREVRFSSAIELEEAVHVTNAIEALAKHISLGDVEIIEYLSALAKGDFHFVTGAAIKALGEVGTRNTL